MRQTRAEPEELSAPEPSPPKEAKPERAARPRTSAPAKPKPARARSAEERPKAKRASASEALLRHAVDRFNESEASRTVAALTKSLGAPRASVQNLSAKPFKAALTVAWELSWYRWEVSQEGETVTVAEVAKGDSVEELTDQAKDWNASVDQDGTVHLRTAAKRRATAGAE
jgi:hypothetical protein